MPFAASTASLARMKATKNASPLRVHLNPAAPRKYLAQCAVVLGEHLPVPFLAELLQKACRSLDVREEQSDRAAGKLPHAHMIALGRGISKDPPGSTARPASTTRQPATACSSP